MKRVPDHHRTIWVSKRTATETREREEFLSDTFARALFAAEHLNLHATASVLWHALRVAVEETRFRGEPLGCAAWRMRVPGTRARPRSRGRGR